MTRLDLLSEVAPSADEVTPQHQQQQHNQQEQQQRSTQGMNVCINKK